MATKCSNILLVSRNIEHLNVISKRLLSSANSSTIGVCNKWKNSSDAGLLQQATVHQNVFCQNKLPTCKFSMCSVLSTPAAKQDSEQFEKKVQENIKSIQDRKFEKDVRNPEELQHFKKGPEGLIESLFSRIKKSTGAGGSEVIALEGEPPIGTHTLPHPIWSEEELMEVKETHKEPERITDKLALACVKTMRGGFDWLSGYNKPNRGEAVWVNRIIFLETVAGVPGMVAAMVRHLHSLRMMRRDHGWIHTLLEEAENERMHLMTALQLKQPSYIFRMGVVGTQGVFVIGFSLAYLISPRFCHRFVGYLEEEAVHTYSALLEDMETGNMKHWKTQRAPDVAIRYWKLQDDATMRDVVLAIRADEAHHRVVNHTLGSMKPTDYNPYKPGE